MKKNFEIQLLCLILCLCMVIPMLASCSERMDWNVTAENSVPLSMTIHSVSGKPTTLVLSYTEDVFSSIRNDQIKIEALRKNNADSAQTAPNLVPVEVKDFSVVVDNAKQLTVTIPNGESDQGYRVAVHSSALSIKKFGEAGEYIDLNITATPTYSASIHGEYAMGDEDPVITVTLKNTVAAENLTKEMITLTDLFADLAITELTATGNSITIRTAGKIPYASPFLAGVKLSEEAVASSTALTTYCDVIDRNAHIHQESFALNNGVLTFTVGLTNDTTSLAVKDTLTANGKTYTVKSVSADRATVTFSVPTAQTQLDAAIAEVHNKTFVIPGNKTASGDELCVLVYANPATVSAHIDYITEGTAANTYKASVLVTVVNGAWIGDLTAADITFGGDLEGATINSIKKNDNSFEVQLTFVKEGVTLETISLLSHLTVSGAKAKNAWGTEMATDTVEMTYIALADRASSAKGLIDMVKSIVKNVKEAKGKYDTVKDIAKTIAGIHPTDFMGTANSIKKILQLSGVIKEKEQTGLDDLKNQIEDVERSIKELDQKLDAIADSVISGNTDIITAVQKGSYLTASGNWNNFISHHVIPLLDILNAYNTAYNEFILSYIGNASTEAGTIKVYIDRDGSVTLPHPLNNTFSIDGLPIASYGEYRLSAELSDVLIKLMRNKGRLYNGYWEDIENEMGTIVSLNGSKAITPAEYLLAVQMNAAMYALNKVNPTDILNAYTNFCHSLAGQGSGVAMKPLDSYLTMLSMYYNFYVEAQDDIETTLAWVSAILIESSGIAALAYEFTPAASEGIIGDSFEAAAEKIILASREKQDHFSFVANRWIVALKVQNRALNHEWWGEVGGMATHTGPDGKFSLELNETSLTEGTFASQEQILLIQKRYENLKLLGITTAENFAVYLQSVGLLKFEDVYSADTQTARRDIRFLVSPLKKEDIKKDNSTTYIMAPFNADYFHYAVGTVVVNKTQSSWFLPGWEIKIGTHGDHRVYASKFKFAHCLKASFLDVDLKLSKNEVLLGAAHYYENHWYWFHEENWYLTYNRPEQVFLLAYGETIGQPVK